MPSRKPRLTITLGPDEKLALEKKAEQFGMEPATFAAYCVRYVLRNFKDKCLPSLGAADER